MAGILVAGISASVGCSVAQVDVFDPATGQRVAHGDVRRFGVRARGNTVERTPGGTIRWRVDDYDGAEVIERSVSAAVKAALSSGS